MNKLQQFNVLELNYNRLKNNNYNIEIGVFEAEQNEELIAVADNECLRAIRRITNHQFSEWKLQKLLDERTALIKQHDSENNKKKIAYLNNCIRELLYVPEYVYVIFPNKIRKKAHDSFNKKGFRINGVRYKWFICGAGHQRTNREIYCAETVYAELSEVLSCGAKVDKIVYAKYNAYYALATTASYRVTPPRCVVIRDKEIKQEKIVDWIDENNNISRQKKELNFNLFDGMGIIDPKFAWQWVVDMGLSYLPSAFIVRCAFIKGLVVLADFHKFAKEVAHKETITDLYGETYNIDDVDVILTESQFKLWSAYQNWGKYLECLSKSGISWGVSIISPEKETAFIRSNYQYLQVLDLTDTEITNICQKSIEWFKGVVGDNVQYLILYLLGKMVNKKSVCEIWDSIQNNFLKALLLNNELKDDEYVRSMVVDSLTKRIQESKFGKLIFDGGFQFMIADPYAFMEYAFGLEINGLLKENEHYSNYWNERQVTEIVAMRSPLTWKSEVNVLNLKNTPEMCEWYKYLYGGIVYNVWGCDCMLHADSDFDGDKVMTTDQKDFVVAAKRIVDKGIPITYKPMQAEKMAFDAEKLSSVVFDGLSTRIGYITNISTTLAEMQYLYDKNSEKYQIVQNRMKICRRAQGIEIDRAKNGSKIEAIPKNWTSYTHISDDMTVEEKKSADLNNELVVEKRPEFMRYLYTHYNRQYKECLDDFNTFTSVKYGCGFRDIRYKTEKNAQEQEIMEYYNQKNPLIETNGTMNRISRYMVQSLKDIKLKKSDCDIGKFFEILYNPDIVFNKNKLEAMLEIYAKYNKFRQSKMLETSPYTTYEQYYRVLRNDALEKISSNICELANLAVYICYKFYPDKKKNFCWDVFGAGIVENLMCKNTIANIPIKCDYGTDVEYLGEKYGFKAFDVVEKCEITEENNDEDYFSVFSDLDL